MKLDSYELIAADNSTTFEFLSQGLKGNINKIIQFQEIEFPNLYNLAFGDLDQSTGQFNDMVVTNNGDSAKVLATVVAAIYTFTKHFPEAWIYATGSTSARTRLYRMGINRYFDVAENDFYIMGKYQNAWERYEKDKDYHSFAVHRKTH